MSFILDALKKSEAQRQRADAPALYEMKMAPRRQGVPAWLLVLGGLLIINIGVLGVVLLRGNHSAAPQADANTTAAPAAAAAVTVAAPPVAAPAVAATPPAARTLAAGTGATAADDAPAVEPAAAPPATNGQVSDQSSGALPTYDQAASTPGANLPELKLDLHAYASNPADRFVYLNMVKLKEGDSTPAGVRVESITPDGAILSWHGSKFFLQRQ